MKRFTAAILTALFIGQSGCDSESNATYEFSGVWLVARQAEVCEMSMPAFRGGGYLEFDDIVVSVYKSDKDETPVATETVSCSAGSFTVDGLARGSYFVKVEAMAQDPSSDDIELDTDMDASVDDIVTEDPVTRAYYVGTGTVTVPSGSEEEEEFELSINTGSIEVGWDFDKGACASDWNNVSTIQVELTAASSSRNDQDSGSIACDINGQTYLFEELDWDVYNVTITGYDPDGVKTHTGALEAPLEVRPGTNISVKDAYIELIPLAD